MTPRQPVLFRAMHLPRLLSLAAVCLSAALAPAHAAVAPTRDAVRSAMQRATRYMAEHVSCDGGYVWTYLPDLSRRWGELEARPTMIWIQGTGTPAMGESFLEAWKATGDAAHLAAAQAAAHAIVAAQLDCGGWNYAADLAGESSLREWYATVGRNAWRLEEFHHYFGNATFDDGTTVSAARFLLHLHLARPDPAVKAALERAVDFILAAQHPVGAWPQRYPPAPASDTSDTARYSSYLTLNDEVCAANIAFLQECHETLGDARLPAAIRRGMLAIVRLQLPAPQPGWALQYTPDDLQPAGARTYEPCAVATHTTAAAIDQLLRFHALTGDPEFLGRIPEALDWLEATRLPPGTGLRGTHPTFIEVGTGRPLYIHRRGSNAINGCYFADGNPAKTVAHYSSARTIDVAALRARYEAARARRPGEVAAAESSLAPDLPGDTAPATPEHVARLLAELDAEGRWLSPLRTTSHPYRQDGSATPAPGDFAQTWVGDETDTSPHGAPGTRPCLSTETFLRNMHTLSAWLRATTPQVAP